MNLAMAPTRRQPRAAAALPSSPSTWPSLRRFQHYDRQSSPLLSPPIVSRPAWFAGDQCDEMDVDQEQDRARLSAVDDDNDDNDNDDNDDDDDDEDDEDDSAQSAASAEAFDDQTRQQRRQTREKLEQVVALLHVLQWSFTELLLAWTGSYTNARDVVLPSNKYRMPAQRRRSVYRALKDSRWRALDRSRSGSGYGLVGAVRGEIDALIQQPSFARFDHRTTIEDFNFSAAFSTIRTMAPTWHHLMTSLLSNQRGHCTSYTGTGANAEAVTKRTFMVTSMVCHARAKKRSNAFPSMLHTYLHGSGMKRRSMEVLSGLGICLSYSSGNRIMRMIAEEAKVCS